MYKITFNGYTIYDPRLDSRGYNILDPKVHLAVGEAGTVSFSMFFDHPSLSQITKLVNTLELTEDGVVLYRGRVINDTESFDKTRFIETEGLLACLNDSAIPPHKFPEDFLEDPDYITAAASGNVVEFYLGWCLDKHNNQVTTDQQIHLGTVTVTDPNNYITRSTSEYVCSWNY